MGLAISRSPHAEALGAESAYPPQHRNEATREAVLRLVLAHKDRRALDIVSKEVGSIGISFAPGTTGIMGGRPRATPLIRLLTAFVDKAKLPAPVVTIEGRSFEVAVPEGEALGPVMPSEGEIAQPDTGETINVPLLTLAFARSGDKGNSSNIAIIARKPEYLHSSAVRLQPNVCSPTSRGWSTAPRSVSKPRGSMRSIFLMQDALGGGGIASPRIDPQGKAFGQMALEMLVEVPRDLVESA